MRGRLRRALDELAVTIGRTGTIVAQTRARLAGQMPDSATRLVSLHDPDARPIRKGRIDRPVEFGYKAQVIDNDDGIVLDYAVEYGAAPGRAAAGARHQAGHPPRRAACPARSPPTAATASPPSNVTCTNSGVRTVAIPRQAKTSPARRTIEHSRGFRKLVKWRTGCEGRISYLKRGYGWDRTRLDGRARSRHLVRARGIRPQPDQDQHPGQLTRTTPPVTPPLPHRTELSPPTFSGRSS